MRKGAVVVAHQCGAKSAQPSPEVTLQGRQLCRAHAALSSDVWGPSTTSTRRHRPSTTSTQTPGHSSGRKGPDHGSLPLPAPRPPGTSSPHVLQALWEEPS